MLILIRVCLTVVVTPVIIIIIEFNIDHSFFTSILAEKLSSKLRFLKK